MELPPFHDAELFGSNLMHRAEFLHVLSAAVRTMPRFLGFPNSTRVGLSGPEPSMAGLHSPGRNTLDEDVCGHTDLPH